MTNEFVLEAITREFPDSVISSSQPYGMLTVEIKKDDIKKVIHYLKDSSLEINFLTDICGIHYPEKPEKEIGVIYHLHNMMTNFRIRLKVFMSRENIEVDSMVELYAGATGWKGKLLIFTGLNSEVIRI